MPLITLCDAASLVWRHNLYGVEGRMGAAADVVALAREAFARPGLTFADVHCALAYAAAGDQAALERLECQLEERLRAGKIAAGEVVGVIMSRPCSF